MLKQKELEQAEASKNPRIARLRQRYERSARRLDTLEQVIEKGRTGKNKKSYEEERDRRKGEVQHLSKQIRSELKGGD